MHTALDTAKEVLVDAKVAFRKAKRGADLADRLLTAREQAVVDSQGNLIDAASYLGQTEAPMLNRFYAEHHRSEVSLHGAVRGYRRAKFAYEHPIANSLSRVAAGIAVALPLAACSSSPTVDDTLKNLEEPPAQVEPKDSAQPEPAQPEPQAPPQEPTEVIPDPAKAEDPQKKEKSKSPYSRHQGSNLWLPAHLFDYSHVTGSVGVGLEESGSGAATDGRFRFESIDVYIRGVAQTFKRIEGIVDAEHTTQSVTGGFRNGSMSSRFNYVQGLNMLDDIRSSTFALSPTLNQTTSLNNRTEVDTRLYSGHMQFNASPDMIVEASAYDLRVIDDFMGNQTDNIVGQTFVPGFGWVPVDSTVATNTRVRTTNRLSGFSFGFEKKLESETYEDIFAGIRATYGDNDIATTVNGTEVSNQNNDFWRFMTSLQHNGAFAEVGYLWQMNTDLDSQIVGTAGNVMHLGDYAMVSPAFSRDDNGKFGMRVLFSFKRPPAKEEDKAKAVLAQPDLQRLIDLQRGLAHNRHDLTLTSDQRDFARLEMVEAYARRSQTGVFGPTIERVGANNRYGFLGAAPVMSDILVFGEGTFGRDYKRITAGAGVRVPWIGGTLRVMPVYLSDGVLGIRDKQGWVSYTIPLE